MPGWGFESCPRRTTSPQPRAKSTNGIQQSFFFFSHFFKVIKRSDAKHLSSVNPDLLPCRSTHLQARLFLAFVWSITHHALFGPVARWHGHFSGLVTCCRCPCIADIEHHRKWYRLADLVARQWRSQLRHRGAGRECAAVALILDLGELQCKLGRHIVNQSPFPYCLNLFGLMNARV